MPCFSPIEGFRAPDGCLVFSRAHSIGLPMRVPCGRCIGCRLERSRQWAVRCMHEASLYEDNCFLTLTYRDDKLPAFGSLVVSDVQKFMKRLRRRFEDTRIRFFLCGEYGSESARAHYHVLLFNFEFPDKVLWRESHGYKCWRSPILESLWTVGQSEIGSLTFESAAYVARYIVKKVTGPRAEAHYSCVDPVTGELGSRVPEFCTMSRRPGIGADWFDLFHSDVYPSDEVTVRGAVCKPPRYYDLLLGRSFPEVSTEIVLRRRRARKREDETAARLKVREVCAVARLNLYGRRSL